MDLPSSHEVRRGPMTRARARALETEVTSFLSDITYDPLETWLLPKSGMLCMIRYQENPSEDARESGQVPKFTDEENQWKESRIASRPRTSDHDPGHPARGALSTSAAQPQAPTSPRHPARSPEIRHPPGERQGQPRYPKHLAPRESPNIRPDARTSGLPICA